MGPTFRGAVGLAIALALPAAARAEEPAGALVAEVATPRVAEPPAPRARFIAAMRYDLGTADAVQVQFADGHTESLKANGGWVLAAGVAVRPTASRAFELRGTMGFKYDSIDAANGSVRYLAFPVEVLAALNLERARLSAGACVSLSPSYKGSGAASDVDVPLKSSLGIVAQAEWVRPVGGGAASLSLGVRGTLERMQAEAGGAATNASTLGLVAGVTL